MYDDNFIRSFTIDGTKYMAAARPSQYKIGRGTPQYFIQVWKLGYNGNGKMYQPAIPGWRLPSVQGYAIRTMNLNVEYSRFIEDFKEQEKIKLGKPKPKSVRDQ